ncbi:MAG: gliding motility-associated-like protein, partial [Limisphaerales bacterium]
EDGVGTSLTDVSGNGHNGSFVGTPTWVTSAAPLGDESVYTYPGLWAGASLSYGLPGGESVLVDTVSGAADGGIHIYYVSDNPNVSSGLSAAVYPWYFGVFGAKTNSYNLKYDLGYDPCDTCFMDMFIRNDNADLTWINNYSDPATVGCKIHLLGESMDLDPYRSEYITSVALIATAPCNDTMDVDTMDIDTVIIIDPPIDTSAVIDSLCEVLFPNAFTPNNDGLNDTWGGYTPCQVPENYLLQIFNRWGERVFFSNNIDQFWDGTYKGKQQHLESYVWLVSYTIDDSSIQEVGNVTLIR